MAKTNAERQAAYRQRRDSERITEEQLKRIIWAAYFVGRGAEREATWKEESGNKDAWSNSFPENYEQVYELVLDHMGADSGETEIWTAANALARGENIYKAKR